VTVQVGQPFAIALVDPMDISIDDAAAQFQYSFACGGGFDSVTQWMDSSSYTCWPPFKGEASREIKAAIRDKDAE
jgi:hypothetical protein